MNIQIVDKIITKEFAMDAIKNKYSISYDGQEIDRCKIESIKKSIIDCSYISDEKEPIIFNEKGELMNGLHRLIAVYETGKSIFEKVALNVPVLKIIDPSEAIENYDEFVWCCASYILDHMGINTRSDSTITKIYHNIYDMVKKYSFQTKEDRRQAAAVVAVMCAVKCGKNEGEISDTLTRNSNRINSIDPRDIIYNVYKMIMGLEKIEIVSIPVNLLLPKSIYEAIDDNN